MNITTLDLSKSSTGWAYYAERANRPYHGVWNRLASEYTSRGQLFYQLYAKLNEHVGLFPTDVVFAEEPLNLIPNSVSTTAENVWIAVGMAATVEMFCHTKRIKLRWVHQAKWRREFLGRMPRGKKSADLKKMAIERCRELGLEPTRHDDAEALGILTYAMNFERLNAPWVSAPFLMLEAGQKA